MTMIDPFTHDQNLDNYSLLFGGTTYDDDDDDGMSRLEEGYECNYANKSFILTDIDNNNNNNLVDFPMADHHDDHREGEEESRRTAAGSGHGSTSKDLELQDAAGGSWLRLGLGRHVTDNPRDNAVDPTSSSSVIRPAAGLLELTLLPAGTTTPGVSQSQPSMILMSAPNPNLNPSNYNSLMFQQQQSHGLNYNYYSSGAPTGPRHPHHQDLNFVFRPTLLTPHPHPHDNNNNNNIPFRNFQSLAAAASSSSNYNFPPTTSGSNNYFTAVPFQQLRPTPTAAAGPSFDFRVISPPRRPHSGLWFILQASQTQSKEPFLPQLPKSYLRIKDGRMTVRMLIKYLLNKLKLDSESEIEIRCKGQQLVPFLTLQYVRDNIWRSKDISATTVSSSSIPRDSSSSSTSSSPANLTTDHVMLLHYSRTT